MASLTEAAAQNSSPIRGAKIRARVQKVKAARVAAVVPGAEHHNRKKLIIVGLGVAALGAILFLRRGKK